MFTGEDGEGGGSGEQGWDLDKIFAEADDLGIPTPGNR